MEWAEQVVALERQLEEARARAARDRERMEEAEAAHQCLASEMEMLLTEQPMHGGEEAGAESETAERAAREVRELRAELNAANAALADCKAEAEAARTDRASQLRRMQTQLAAAQVGCMFLTARMPNLSSAGSPSNQGQLVSTHAVDRNARGVTMCTMA
jgi:chromosome segregation ATPase